MILYRLYSASTYLIIITSNYIWTRIQISTQGGYVIHFFKLRTFSTAQQNKHGLNGNTIQFRPDGHTDNRLDS